MLSLGVWRFCLQETAEICNCEIPPEGEMGCLDNCMNRCAFIFTISLALTICRVAFLTRHTMIECTKFCRLGNQCGNRRFSKRQHKKVSVEYVSMLKSPFR